VKLVARVDDGSLSCFTSIIASLLFLCF
jgi:hypothetical protein